jgi:hypothetical protein
VQVYKQYRFDEEFCRNLFVAKFPLEAVTWFWSVEGVCGNCGAMMVEQGRQQDTLKHCYITAIADSGSIGATMLTHPFGNERILSEMSATCV